MKYWVLQDFGVWMDGGSLTIQITDKLGMSHQINIIQHVVPEYYPEMGQLIPGRLYFNEELIEKRSPEETAILTWLLQDVLPGIPECNKPILAEKLDYLRSTTYLDFLPKALPLYDKRKKHLGLL